ncbi:hypothetical protein BDZ89DRAFT_1163064 [Hymenopellis radicata]|nr:hypothetical protein BDZ89DRAFT_1163064 [Hymenopellis radicata]
MPASQYIQRPPRSSRRGRPMPLAGKRQQRRTKMSSSIGNGNSSPSTASDDLPIIAEATLLPDRRIGAIVLTKRDDSWAAQIIMALIHDCFIVINQAQRGAPVESAFSLRFRLLSLYIVEEDVRAFKTVGAERTYQAIEELLALRRRTLFCGKTERARMGREKAADESRELRGIIESALQEPLVGMDGELLESIRRSLELPPTRQDRVVKICNAIRGFFDLAPWRPQLALPSNSSSADDELFLLHDIFHSLEFLCAEEFPGYDYEDLLISLPICNAVPEHIQSLILVRDLLSGALSGPCTLRGEGAFSMYVSPLLQCRSTWLLHKQAPVWAKLDEDLSRLEDAFLQNDGQGSYWLSYLNSRRGLGLLLPDDSSLEM